MCARFTFLSYDEVADVIYEMHMKTVLNPLPDWPAVHATAYPKSLVTVIRTSNDADEGAHAGIRADDSGLQLEPATLVWGFEASWSKDVVFNTRIESADKPFWQSSMRNRRCLVPALGFYEPHRSETTISPKTGKEIKRSYYFEAPGREILLLAGLWSDKRFSILTTEPSPSVAPIHARMPLIVRPSEVPVWFGDGYRALADRSQVALDARRV